VSPDEVIGAALEKLSQGKCNPDPGAVPLGVEITETAISQKKFDQYHLLQSPATYFTSRNFIIKLELTANWSDLDDSDCNHCCSAGIRQQRGHHSTAVM